MENQTENNNNNGFQIHIKTLTGQTVTLNGITSNTSVPELKNMIYEKERIPVDQQRLVFCSKQLEDNHNLGYYEIGPDSSIHLVLRLKGGLFKFQNHVKTLTGQTITLNGITSETSISELKNMICKKEKIPVDQQRLIYCSKHLEDDNNLDYYGIGPDSSIHLLFY